MTVSELIKALAEYPPDLRVVVDGYEDGYDDLTEEKTSLVKITLNTGTADWMGQHGDASYLPSDAVATTEVVEALALHRGNWS